MPRYFKLVCLHEEPDWYISEFRAGRARFGWGQPGRDLQQISAKPPAMRSNDERVTWSYTQFLMQRISPGDCIVIQPETPIKRFLIGEVVAPGYAFSPGNLNDFNHMLHVTPLTPQPIPINSKAVSASLKHDLSKRGHYYEIYPESSIEELDALVAGVGRQNPDLLVIRTDEDILDKTVRDMRSRIVHAISQNWQSKDFERFCELLCTQLDYIEVKERRDSGQGWDLLVRLINPLTDTILMDDIPVQCKNYVGSVTTSAPLDDLERCVRNSGKDLAYLFILGDLPPDFSTAVRLRQEALRTDLGRPVTLEVVDQDRIAELYATYLVRPLRRTQSVV